MLDHVSPELSYRRPLFDAGVIEEEAVEAVDEPQPIKAGDAEAVYAAAGVVGNHLWVHICAADFGEPFQKIAVFAEDEVFAETLDLLERISFYDDAFTCARAVMEYVVEKAVDEIVEPVDECVPRSFKLWPHALGRCERNKRGVFFKMFEGARKKFVRLRNMRIGIHKDEHVTFRLSITRLPRRAVVRI